MDIDLKALLIEIASAFAIVIVYLEPRYRKLRDHIEQGINDAWEQRIKLKDEVIADQKARIDDLKKELSLEQGEAAQYKEAWEQSVGATERAENHAKLAEETYNRYKHKVDTDQKVWQGYLDNFSELLGRADREKADRQKLSNLLDQLSILLSQQKQPNDEQ